LIIKDNKRKENNDIEPTMIISNNRNNKKDLNFDPTLMIPNKKKVA
jgi:hypothetical protein